MLYLYKDKIYVKPYENKIVEVVIKKTINGYDAEATKNVIVEDGLVNKLQPISIEEAYNLTNTTKKGLKSKEEDF